MAYSPADLDAVDRAIVALATGARRAQVTFADGRSVRYGDANLKDLRDLRAQIAASVPAIGQDPAQMSGGITYVEWTRS